MDTESRWHRIWLRIKDLYYTGPPAIPADEVGVAYDESPSIKELKALFEGKEAIFFWSGAIKVRVSKIRGSTERSQVWADIDEIQTPGLGVGGLNESWRKGQRLAHWRISAGPRTAYSENEWEYGWFLYFDPPLIQHVLDLAANFPENMGSGDRYNAIVRYLQYERCFPETYHRLVFPDHPLNKARRERWGQ